MKKHLPNSLPFYGHGKTWALYNLAWANSRSFPKPRPSNQLGEADGISYVALGYCHLSLGRVVSAENAYRMGILLHPESTDARNGLVNCLLTTNRFAEALALLDELLETKPNDLFCHKARASALQGLGREEDAVMALETLRRMNRLDAAGTLSLGDIYHNLGLNHLSLASYQQALAKKEKLSLSRYARAAKY
jgi:tetratricopeptide (TPR) repeat protein